MVSVNIGIISYPVPVNLWIETVFFFFLLFKICFISLFETHNLS